LRKWRVLVIPVKAEIQRILQFKRFSVRGFPLSRGNDGTGGTAGLLGSARETTGQDSFVQPHSVD